MVSRINVSDFDLAATLECGQAFRWSRGPDGWFAGVVGGRVLRVRLRDGALEGDVDPHYFALDVSLPDIVATFPDDEPLRAAVKKHWGLRVLRQEPWETLASFIASSTKQIVQIRQIVANLSGKFGKALGVRELAPAFGRQRQQAGALQSQAPLLGDGNDPGHSFPAPDTIARASLPELAACKLGFRAKYLLAAARAIDSGKVRLDRLPAMDYDRALEELMKLDGVGEKIAACTLLFSCGHDEAFPIDVWVERALRRLYFAGRKATARQLREFARSHFGPYAGWAQQYLFFNERTQSGGGEGASGSPATRRMRTAM
jgi:N-glycosylase/DNA lyase